jgi:hypothetical protein
MRNRVKLLSLVVRATLILLACGAVLVVLGIFNTYLKWDIFSPQVEKLLWGIFSSCLALAAFGVAASVVLGIQEVVTALRRMIEAAAPSRAEPEKEAPRRSYALALAALLLLLAVTVVGFNLVNHRIETHRLAVFKLVVRDQMHQLGPHLQGEVAKLQSLCETCAPPTLLEFMHALGKLSFCQSSTLYLAEPTDPTVLWKYPAGDTLYSSDGDPKIERFFIANDVDRAIKQALSGDTAWIDQMNGAPSFEWYQPIRDSQGKVRAVLRILGNPKESYRNYKAATKAAKGEKTED